MATTFISHNRLDLDFVEKLEQALQEKQITTWREKGELYGEKGWPKVIGEAIAAYENFLVIWSKNSAISHIVEYELNMALLMQRKIIAIVLDGAPFRENMAPTYTIHWSSFNTSIKKIMKLLDAPSPRTDAKKIQDILKKLSRFNETKPAQVTRKMRIVYFNSRIENPLMKF